MPVTHGVRGSSPLRTAEEDNRKVVFFFLCILSEGGLLGLTCKSRENSTH